jgi:TRAP-type uncharacterized transport system substrate-binding protein
MKKLLLFSVVMAFGISALSAFAAPPKGEVVEAMACSETALKIGTGPKGKGYSKLFTDMNKVCGGVVEMCEVNTSGALDNLTGLSTNEQDVGLTSVDAAMYMQNGDENIKELMAVMSINNNFVHVIVSTQGYTVETKKWGGISKEVTTEYIRKFSDLRGKTVALVGSGQFIGRKLNDQLQLGMFLSDVATDAAAFDMVKKGGAHAMMTVSGWPSGPVSGLNSGENLTLVPFDVVINPPYLVKPVNYKNLGVYNVAAVGVPNVLMSRPFKAGGEKATMVSRLKNCLKSNMVKMQEGSFQAAWKEAKDIENVYGWNKFQASGETRTAKK